MPRFRQHIPAFFDPGGFENKEIFFGSTQDLLNIPIVKSFSKESNFVEYA